MTAIAFRCLYCFSGTKDRPGLRKFCSDECRRSYHYRLDHQRYWATHKWAKWRLERTCGCGCGHKFVPIRPAHRFFTGKCKDHHNGRIRAGRRHYSWRVIKNCATCQQQFLPVRKNQKYCCHWCLCRNPEQRQRSNAANRAWAKKNPEKVKEFQRARYRNRTEEQRLRQNQLARLQARKRRAALVAMMELGLLTPKEAGYGTRSWDSRSKAANVVGRKPEGRVAEVG